MTILTAYDGCCDSFVSFCSLECGIDPSIRHRIDEQREAKAMAAQSLQMRTDALRAKNVAARQERQNRQNLSPWQRGYRSF